MITLLFCVTRVYLASAAAVAPAQPASQAAEPAAAVAIERQVAPVFRCIFEDRSRMVIVRLSPDVWLAFNPGTCGVQKVWRGTMKFRGKVWDFSQDNCAAGDDAIVIMQAHSTLAGVEDLPALTPGWTTTGVEMPRNAGRGEGWRFSRPDSSLVSPVFDASGWQRVFIAFDETGRSGPFKVEVSDNVGVQWNAQSFESTTHGTSDSDWQFNFKLLEKPASSMRVRWTVGAGGIDKKVRNVQIFGDRVPWSLVVDGKEQAVTPVWRGYERKELSDRQAPVYTLLFGLKTAEGAAASVRQEIFRADDWAVQLSFAISGLPPGATLRLATPMQGVDVVSARVESDGRQTPIGSSSTIELKADAKGEAHLTLTTNRKGARP